jgi:hypothetical protein
VAAIMSCFRTTIARERGAAVALLTGSLLGLAVMACHPTGRELLARERAAAVRRDQLVHGVAIAAIALQTFGTLAITRRVARRSLGFAELAQVAQVVAAAAGCLAAIASGFVAPGLLAMRDGGPPPELWSLNHHVNQVFAGTYVIAAATAMASWSIAGWSARLPRTLSAFGIVVAPLAAALVAAGHLRLDIHGFGAILLGQAAWLAGVAVVLMRAPAASETDAPPPVR